MKLSIVIPLLNEEPHLEQTLETIRRELAIFEGDYELVLIDDGSSDGTWELLRKSVAAFGDARAIRLSRRFGKELAMCAGIERSRGDAVVVMDGDLQHPPRLIPEMVRGWEEEGFDIVEGVKKHRGDESSSYRTQTGFYYFLLRSLSGIDLKGASDFKLMDRRVVDAWSRMGERNVFFRGMSAWLGFRRKKLYFDVEQRAGGRSAWSSLGLIRLAINGITSFSSLPVHIITVMGAIFLCFALLLGANSIVQWFSGEAVTGFTTVNLLLLIIGSMLMIGLGIIGEYIAKIYDEVKGRPRFVIAEIAEPGSEGSKLEAAS
ncbi:MAG: glycosyltransferase family 2 protein [Deltaproteobacteria bacterium]|nr:glycosyltransferase family 2 protein [Deltaproteobacteria bacterium]